MRYLTIPETAALLRKSVTGLSSDITRNPQALPPFYKIGRKVLFSEADIHTFVKSKQVNHLGDETPIARNPHSSGKKRGRPAKLKPAAGVGYASR